MKHTASIKYSFLIIILFVVISGNIGCQKYLDAKPDKSLQVPSTLADLQAILNFTDDMNNASPMALELPADDYKLLDASWNSLSYNTMKNLYIWEKDVFNDNLSPGDWASAYVPVYRANLVLERLADIPRTEENRNDWDAVKGGAMLYRSRSFYEVAQVWAKAYDKTTASKDLGIPIRLSSDFNKVSVRSNLQETYNQIIQDLTKAISLLPNSIQHVMSPSKPAAYGMLARTYLAMQEYEKAGKYADSCLNIKSTLIDYNDLSTGLTYPFARFNSEVIFNTIIPAQTVTTNARIDAELYASYSENDLRKNAFFKNFAPATGGGVGFKGSYYGSGSLFNGIATNEMFLIRAEANARQQKTGKALEDLNTLLIKRYITSKFQPYTLQNTPDPLRVILVERRKELLFRGLRWTDLKRLNREPVFAKTINRVLNAKLYELPPNDPRYAIAIPNSVIEITGIPQN